MKFVPARASRFVMRQKLKIDSNSPTILLVAGITGVVGTTVLASRATLKAQPVLEAAENELNEIEYQAHKNPREFPESVQRKQRVHVYVRTVGQLGKLYGPSIVLGGISISCLVGSHKILQDRYSNMAAAYVALGETMDAYRKRVRAEIGDDKERDLFYAGKDVTYIEPGPNGPKKKTERTFGTEGGSPFARLFSQETSTEWKNTPEFNVMFLRQVEKHCNVLLRDRGHLFLNRVYEELGLEDTEAGAVCGWLYERGTGDDYVDFGIWGDSMRDRLTDFMIGNEGEIFLDFNCDGPIHKLLSLPKVHHR
jgi:hypothetical protein